MAYPKPLSPKSLERLYKESGLTDEQQSFLHKLFAACANLYGILDMRGVWSFYQALGNVPKLRRKDVLAFSSIARREEQPYYIFEIEELYSAEPHNELSRHIVHRDLIRGGHGRYYPFYGLMETLDEKPYCLPEDLLSYAEPSPSEQEQAFASFISQLRSTATECKPRYGKSYPNDHTGQALSEFSFLNSSEQSEVEWLKNQPSAQALFIQSVSGSEADKIVRLFKQRDNIGSMKPAKICQLLYDELTEVGVELAEAQMDELIRLAMDLHNNSHLWCLKGWTPIALRDVYHRLYPSIKSFEPGIKMAFADGSMSKDELVKALQGKGLNVIN